MNIHIRVFEADVSLWHAIKIANHCKANIEYRFSILHDRQHGFYIKASPTIVNVGDRLPHKSL